MELHGASELSPRERAVIDFERTWWQLGASAKADAIREHLGLSGTRYYEVLRRLCESPAARAYDPLVIHRVRRDRIRRRRARFEGPTASRPPAR